MPARIPTPTTLDFETFKIEGRPVYPPLPISVSIKRYGAKARNYAWGHTHGNNCSWSDAKGAIVEALKNPDGVLCHHAKFDLDIIETHFGLKLPPWQQVHDTLFLVFLDDPNIKNAGLKETAERLYNDPPAERDAVADWLVKHQPVPGAQITHSKSKQSKAPFICYLPFAPGDLVGSYANGDVERTERVFRQLYPTVIKRGMGPAYDRERKLLFVLLDMERQGIPVDLPRLRADVALYRATMGRLDTWLIKKLKSPGLNLNAGGQVIDALVSAGLADPDAMPRTPTGLYSSDEAAFDALPDRALGAVLKYRSKLRAVLATFLEKWLETAESSGGLIYTNWNQTKAEGLGARTGRLSSNPNFQNISKQFDAFFRHEESDEAFKKRAAKAKELGGKPAVKHPVCPIPDLPPLPLARSYIAPWSKDDVLIDRDWSQQEPRILAHFEGGALLEQYAANPWIDFHDNAKEHIEKLLRRTFVRTIIKNINLGLIYGQGVGSLAEKNNSTVAETKQLKDAILALYPGLRGMYSDMRERAKTNVPIRTWGGREYYCEPTTIVNGRARTWDYKMVNTLIQGSAADCTKEALIRYYASKPKTHRLYMSVHDELLVSCPKLEIKKGMDLLRIAMESVEFDVKILSEGKFSNNNWAAMHEYDVKGSLVYSSSRIYP